MQPEHEREVVRQAGEERDLGRAGVREHRGQAAPAEEVERLVADASGLKGSVYTTGRAPAVTTIGRERSADLGVCEAAEALASRALSSRELTEACLARIRERDGTHSHEGDPDSINAWVRVYEEDALAAADRGRRAARSRRRAGPVRHPDRAEGPLRRRRQAADRVEPRAGRGPRPRLRRVGARSRREGMVLLGHLHTHEFACGGTTDQVGNPWALERSAGGSSGGSGAALASKQVPAATGTDTAGSLRIPSAECGTSTIKPTRGLALAPRDRPARADLRPPRADDAHGARLRAAARGVGRRPSRRRSAARSAGTRSPRGSPTSTPTSPTGSSVRSRRSRASGSSRRLPHARLDVLAEFFDLVLTEMLVWHRRFDDRWGEYRYSNRARLEHAVERAMTAEEYVAGQVRRVEDADAWRDWLAEHRIDAIVEPTLPIVAPVRGRGYDEPFGDLDDLSLTHYWDWTGFPVVALPVRRREPERPADERLADRRAGLRVGPARVGRGAPGRARYGLAVIDLAAVTAIDVHVHTELTRDGHDPMPPRAARSGRAVLQERRAAADGRRRRRLLPRAEPRRRPVHRRLGVAQRHRRRSRTRRSSTRPRGTRT